MSKRKLMRLVMGLSVLGACTAMPLSVTAAETIDWSRNTVDLRSQIGQTFSFICPPGGTVTPIRGSVIYTDDSSVCSAAVHAGEITVADGGEVTLKIVEGQEFYPGYPENGVSSENHVNGEGSFTFFFTEQPTRNTAQSQPAARTARDNDIYMRFDLDEYVDPRYLGQEFTFNCVMHPWSDDSIWGTDVYHSGSSVCLAAIHSGLITAEEGGEITLRIGPGQPAYSGSSRNGVSSDSYTSYQMSTTCALRRQL